MKAKLTEYESKYAREITHLWRSSFKYAMDLTELPNDFEQQMRFLDGQIAVENQIFLMSQEDSGTHVGFMALQGNWINHLYIHVEFLGQGLGTRLLNLAKESSSGELGLYTFNANKNAQRFYEGQGFSISRRGVADINDNPWTKDESLLEDIEYYWHR